MRVQARLIGVVTATVVLVLLSLLVIVAGPTVAGSSEPSPSCSPSAPPSPSASPSTPPAASVSTVRWARHWRRVAGRARTRLSRVRICMGGSAPVRLQKAPKRAASAAEWKRAGRSWRARARDWQAKARAGVAKMRRPGGSGAARWWPAARYCGWPAHLKGWFCYVVWRESNGRPQVVNRCSGCYGLLQLHPCHWGGKGRAWIRDPFNQLRLGWKLYRGSGASPWAL